MGAWGTGLYADDTCCDVREDYVKFLKQGMIGEAAVRQILERYGTLLEDVQIACQVYLPLADTAWRYGRLDENLKQTALALLAAGGDLDSWRQNGPRDLAARRRVLKALEGRLTGPLPPEKPVRVAPPRPRKIRTTAPVGSMFALDLPSGHKALMILVGFKELAASTDPVFSIPLWRGMAVPGSLEQGLGEIPMVHFQSGLGVRQHVAILPGDERQSILKPLHRLEGVWAQDLPYDPDSVVWLAIGRIAEEVDAAF